MKSITLFAVLLSLVPIAAWGQPLKFPRVAVREGTEQILQAYSPYLDFVLQIGGQDKGSDARALSHAFVALKQQDPIGAAHFLKGLRFEMLHKLEIEGLSPEEATGQNATLRNWVGRFLSTWTREADEQLFRAVTLRERKPLSR